MNDFLTTPVNRDLSNDLAMDKRSKCKQDNFIHCEISKTE